MNLFIAAVAASNNDGAEIKLQFMFYPILEIFSE